MTFRVTVLFALLALLAACDEVENRYNSLEAARAANLFDSGWLPDVLPKSATDIRVSSNMDTNISTGGFKFEPADASGLYQSLTSGAPATSRLADWEDIRNRYASEGFTSWTYREPGSPGATWVFFCSTGQGRCDYFMW